MHDFPNLTLIDHPLVQHRLALLRDRETSERAFRELLHEISILMGYELTRDLPVEPVEVVTPLEPALGHRLSKEDIALIPVLRAGLGMVDGLLRLLPSARVGHLGLYREPDTLQPVRYYFRIPPAPHDQHFIVLDPMLATGGSASAAARLLKEHGARSIRLLCLIAAPEGVRRMLDDHPDIPIFAAALDRQLDEHGYIRPGLGDAGDRLFGTR